MAEKNNNLTAQNTRYFVRYFLGHYTFCIKNLMINDKYLSVIFHKGNPENIPLYCANI
jgi:hypothetical protein